MKNQNKSDKKIKDLEIKSKPKANIMKTENSSAEMPVFRLSKVIKKKSRYGAFNSILPTLTLMVLGISILSSMKMLNLSREHHDNEKIVREMSENIFTGHATDDYRIEKNVTSGKYESVNPANRMKFVYEKDGFTASTISTSIPEKDEEWSVKLKVESGKWKMESGELGIESGELRVESGEWKDDKSNFPSEEYIFDVNSNSPLLGRDRGGDLENNSLSVAGNKASIENDKMRIDYINNEKGMRQDFIIKQKPNGKGKLKVDLTAETKLNMNIGDDELIFSNSNGDVKMKYSALKVWDAKGKTLHARFEAGGNSAGFSIVVDDNDAVYPVTIDPLSTSPSTVLTGSYSFGSAANPAGDVNGDGYDDVIVGAKETTTIVTNDGKVSLFYGTSSGLSTSPAWTVIGESSNTAFGNSVATAGDVNGDGYDDFLIGHPGYKVAGVSRGRALLYLGSASGPDTVPSWTAIGYTISDLGRSVYSAGDVNNDGYDDILVSSAYATFGGSQTGAVYMYYGSATGPDTIPDWEVRGDNPFQNFGNSVCTAGDVNNDGFDDVIVGAHSYSSSAGAVYVYHGSASGLPATPNWTKTGAASGNKFGFIVYKAGDVNGDGFDDVVIGEPNTSSPGKTYVFHGSSSGLPSNANWSATGSSSSFGHSAATAGDYNGDGFFDIIVGKTDSNKVFVFKGSSAGLSANSVWSYAGDGSVSVLGFNVATAGDVNGDGYSDVMAAGYSPKVYIFNGSMDTGNVIVSGAVARNGEYETLADAFSAINSNTQTGAIITVTIKGNTNEPTTGALLNANAWNSLTVIPSGARTVSGQTAYNTPLITLNGADNVVIDGLDADGNSLTITNSNSVIYYEGITLSIKNDASNNAVRRCSIYGSAITGQLSEPSVIYFGTGNTTGNDNNVISYCNLSGAGGNLPTFGIRSSGSTSNETVFNSGDTIRDCNIYDCFNPDRTSSGVSIFNGSTNFIIKNNRFYQTAARTITFSNAMNKAIDISNTSGNNFLITGNVIGHSNSAGTGVYSISITDASGITPIDISAGNVVASEVSGNKIRSIAVTGTSMSGSNFIGLQVTNGNVNVTGNEIGDSASISNIDISGWSGNNSSAYGIKLSGSGNCLTSDNSIYGFRYTRTNPASVNQIAIISSLSGNWTCENNIIGSSLANSISNNSTNTGTVTSGIHSTGGAAVISGNIIRNLNTTGGTIFGSSPNPFTGISVTASGSQTVSGNIIHSLSNTNPDLSGNGGASHLLGIYISNSTGNIVEKNLIHSLKINSNIGVVTGVNIASGSSELRNNMIRIGIDQSGNGTNNPCTYYGISESGGNNDIYHNSIYIGGNPVAGNSSSTWCLYSNSSATRNYFCNILFNARSNNGSNGIHGAIRVNSLTGLSANYNVLFANGTGGITGYYSSQRITLAQWITGTGKDSSSKSANPNFVNPAGNSQSIDLHTGFQLPTPSESNGISIPSVTTDFDGELRSSLTPHDIGADAGNFAQLDEAPMTISYLPITTANNNLSVLLNSVSITDGNGINISSGTKPRVYYRKKSDANVFNDNTSSTAGWKYSEADNTSSPFSFTILFSRLNSAIAQTDSIQYFVIAQDLASLSHVGVNSALFNQYPLSVNLGSSTFPVSGSINSFTFQNFNVIVSGAVTGNGIYSNLSSAFTALNSGAQTSADINVQIAGNTTEPSSGATLNENDWNTLTIVPVGDTARTVTGAITGGLSLINLNGADRVKIDGLNTGGNSLTLINTTFTFTPGTSTINFKSDASNNVITNCTILSSAAVNQSFDGGAINFGAGTVTGNNNNVISYCNISKSPSGQVTKAVAFLGSTLTTAYNKGDTIRNCNIYDYGYGPVQSGIAVLSGNTDIVIKDNKFYQTGTVTLNSSATHSAVRIESPLGNGFDVSNNIIGFASSAETGKYTVAGSSTARFQPILMQAGSIAASNIQGNTIKEISMSGTFSGVGTSAAFIGILVTSGSVNIGNIAGNTIGSQNATQSISLTSTSTSSTEITGIHTASTTPCNTIGNSVGGIYGVQSSTGGVNLFGTKNTSTGMWTCQNNIFGGSIANSMQTLSTATSTIMIGIQNTGGSSVISGNTIRNFTSGGGLAGTYPASAMGILVNPGSSSHTVANNLVHSISNINSTQASILSGILINGASTGNEIRKNFIHSISAASLSAAINGIHITGGTSTYSNNMISLGGGMNTGCAMNGIYETGGTNNIQYNSILLSGNPSASSINTFTFRSTVNTVTRNYINNIFFNSRSNNGASGKHYAISLAGTAPLPAGCTSNNNLFFSNGTGGVMGLYNASDRANLASWLSATGLDSNSVNGNPNFVSISDLHIDTAQSSPAGNAGRTISGITEDFDGNIRNANTPDIGADEFNSPDPEIQLNLTVFFEGFYNAGTDSQISDTIRAYLRNSSSPFQVVDSAKAIAGVNGSTVLVFANAPSGTYFVALAHRNTLETWSASPIAMTGGNAVNYDMSAFASQAYGNNLIQVDNSPLRFALYSGDANQDGTVDATDLSIIDNDAANFNSGYLPSDINGDDFIDGTDYAIADNNAANFVSVIEP